MSSLGKSLLKSKKRSRRLTKNHEGDESNAFMTSGTSSKITQSVTDETSLDEFLSKATLAGTEFTAEHMKGMKVISSETKEVVGVLSSEELARIRRLHAENMALLKIPRRPQWDANMTTKDLNESETRTFLEWRRRIADLQELDGIVLTPFERNLELWRQLWRVIERSDVVMQILDARNPLLTRCLDLEAYVKEVDQRKTCVLLLNKADLLTEGQRRAWAEYFEKEGVKALFWSATLAVEKSAALSSVPQNHTDLLLQEVDQCDSDSNSSLSSEDGEHRAESFLNVGAETVESTREEAGIDKEKAKILTAQELLDLMRELSTAVNSGGDRSVIGMVGYPNVGKSSTINKLIGEKKASVSITPGKTKHFQTLPIGESLILCDCPGLVLPSFSLSREEMIVNGIFPVNQMRGDPRAPIGLLCSRFPRGVWERKYGITLPRPTDEEHPGRNATPGELLTSLAFNRGFMSSKGIPDASRAARLIISDVISGKLTWAAAPPTMCQKDFNDFKTVISQGLESFAENPPCSGGGAVQLEQLEKRHLLERKPHTEQMDKAFFRDTSRLGPHLKGAKAGGRETKKHFNKKKKEKLRRLYKDLDA